MSNSEPKLGMLWAGCLGISLIVGIPFLSAQEAAPAQPAMRVGPGGSAPIVIGPDGKPIRPGVPSAPGQPGAPTPPGQPVAAKPEEKKEESSSTVARPTKPPLPPDPRELKVVPNAEGKLQFNFHGQSWADVLEWLARVSGMSLDWQELPGDYLNLVTQREYTLPEARDLINRHLLARGYTMIQQGEVLSVVNLQKLNPGMVPRVEPEELSTRLPHEFVKVSFSLDWLLSEKAVEELKPMLSPNAKITALKNTNRIEAVDAVINLREVYEVLQREQSSEDERLVREFVLKHTRATDVIEQLQLLLGLEAKPKRNRSGAQDQTDMMQQQQMMMMQMRQQQGGQQPPQPKKEEDVHLVANARKNSILVNAPPDKMEIVSQAILTIDVETDRTQSLLANINRMQVYRLHSIDPEALVNTLLEIGEMDPGSRLEVDTKNKAVIAYATLADHLTIRQLVERLDGSTRKFEVLQLRRLEADYVAGTIEFMMSGPKQQEQQQPRYFDYYYSPRRTEQSSGSTDEFRVDADVENNRLLLWANEIEMQEVTNLLVKLGEVPAQGGSNSRIRVLDAIPPDEVEEVLEKLRQAWPSLGPNPLNLPPAKKSEEPKRQEGGPKPELPETLLPHEARRKATNPRNIQVAFLDARAASDDTAASNPPANEADRPADPPQPEPTADKRAGTDEPRQPANQPSPSEREGEQPSVTPRDERGQGRGAAPPITIGLTPDGRLMISSQDTQALDVLEELIAQVAPPRRDYHVFKLKFASSYWVATYLKDFFEEGDGEKKNTNSRTYYYYDYYNMPDKKDEPRHRLSKRRKLKFIDDPDTNSILVQGADNDQLKTIEDLIAIYDQPQQADANAARLTAVFQIKYSKASTIAEAVKDVYRDLLSSNDKALQQQQNGNPEQRNRGAPGATTYIFNEGGDAQNEKERTRVSFKGKLSIGVDEVTNTLLVSAEGEILMRNVTEMVNSLDEAAKPLASVSVVKLQGGANTERVREVLSKLLIEAKPEAKKPDGQPGRPPQQGPNGNIQGAVPAQAIQSE